jgi:hypothetical protein
MKNGQKSIFHPCEAHIIARLDITMMYTSVLMFWKYQISVQNRKGLAFGFNEKCLFTVKTGRKSIFHPREAHILSRLDILVLYINFYGFWKILSFDPKPKEVSLRILRKMSARDENLPEIRISSPWGSYCVWVRCFGVVHKFIGVLKNIEFQLKTQRGLPSVLPKIVYHDENWQKIHIWSLWCKYSCSARYYGVVHNFLRFWKYWGSTQNPKVLAFCFTENRLFMAKMGQKSVFHLREGHILSRLDILLLYIYFKGFDKYWLSAQNPKS